MQISFHNELRQFSGFFARAMTSRDCFYCGKRVAAGKSCSVLFLDGRGYPPRDSEIIQYAQLCDTTRQHDEGHAALLRGVSEIACNSYQCYRLIKDVNNYVVSNVRVTRSLGEASTSTPILPAHRKVLTRCSPPQRWHLKPQGNRKVTLTHKSALEPAELHSLGAQRRSNHRMRSSHLLDSSIIASMDSVTPYD
jgi:hypothetical protein